MLADEIQELYQEMIIEHGRSPRFFGVIEDAENSKTGLNPICGDQITVYIKQGELKFSGHGCAICMASTSILIENIQNKTKQSRLDVIAAFRNMLQGNPEIDEDLLGKLVVLSGVKAYPSRIKCATLGCHAVKAVLEDIDNDTVSTES